jgi:serralysin
MANFFAFSAVNINGLDLSGLQNSQDSGFDSNVFETVNGVTYEDIVWFEEGPSAVGFGGSGIVLDPATERVTAGNVTGVLTEQWNGSTWVDQWMLQGINVSAVSLYNAAMTSGTGDDLNIVAAAMAGADVFQLSAGNDVMRGFGGNDRMLGKGGRDTLYGDGGSDVLTGGAGIDNLYGGAGADVFDYNLATESIVGAQDVIRDFVRGTDRIDLRTIDANTGSTGDQNFTGFIRASATFTTAGQLKFSGGVLYGNTDGDSAAEFAITVTGVTGLNAADVIL